MTATDLTTSASRGGLASDRGTPSGNRRIPFRLDRVAHWFFVAPAVIYVALFFGYPIVKNFIMGFQNYSTSTFFTGVAPWVGFSNYVRVISSSIFSTAITNTALFTIGSIAGQFVLGLLLALFFKRRFPLSGVLRALMLLPWLLPLIASSAVWKWMFDQGSGIINQALLFLHLVPVAVPWIVSPSFALISVIIVNIWLGIPFNMTILYGGLQGVPDELYEAASLDGATGWKAFRHITWPSLRPVVTVVLVLGVVYTLKVLDIILGLTGGGPANATETLATDSYHQSFVLFSFGDGAALSNILIIISLIFTVVYLRLTRRAVDD
jgi:multiple sugar transport system permease protein